MDEWVDRSKIHTSHTYTIILCFFWTLASALKQPVQVSKDSSAAFFSIFALHARRPQQKTGKIFVMGSLQKVFAHLRPLGYPLCPLLESLSI